MGISLSEDKNTQEANKNQICSQDYYARAEELRLTKEYKASIENYLHSIFIDRKNTSSYVGLAISYRNLKNYDKAISILKKADEITPNNIAVQKELAMCNIIEGNYCEGIKYLMNSIKLEPDNTDVQMQLALVHEMIEEEDMALMIYQRIIEKNPDYIRAYIQKATLYMHLEDYLNSAKVFKTVIKLNSDYYRAYLALGICLEKLGNKAAAKRYYQKYLKQNKSAENKEEVFQRIADLKINNTQRASLRVI